MREVYNWIAIVGAGAWGTALCQVVRRAGRDVVLWAREPEVAESVNRRHENADFLPGITLDAGVRATSILEEAASADAVVLAVPAQFLRSVALALAPAMRPRTPVVVCAKGIERDTCALMSEVVAQALPGHPIAALSGPTFAGEVARGLPTAVTLAADDARIGAGLVEAMGSQSFRPYLAPDVPGTLIGGAVKNVIAIACGIAEGRQMGENARAALITRGLAEMTRLAVKKGGRAETMMGLSGLGDLTLTCTSTQSRNYSLGRALGEGRTLADILAERKSVAEGVESAASVAGLATRIGVEVPISEAVDAVLTGASIDDQIGALLARPFRTESVGA